jgi:6-phosphogluconolactonase (cycloisomerase 2 family)
MPHLNKLKWYRVGSLLVCTCLLSSCGGSDGSSAGEAPAARVNMGIRAYAYLATPGTLTTYSVDPSTGALMDLGGSPLTFPVSWPFEGIRQIATDSSGQTLYLLHYSGVHAYTIDRNAGALTEVAGSPFASGVGPSSFALDESGAHLFVASDTSPAAPINTLISAFSVNGPGVLVPLANYTVSGELSTLATAGSHLYVAGFYTNSISVFSIEPSGELIQNVPGSPFATDTGPHGIAVDPSGAVLYTANDGMPTANEPAPGSISAFTIDSSTGALTPVTGNPLPIAAAGQISIDPMGRFLFVPETNGVSVYAINTTTGVLTEVAGSPFLAGTAPVSVSVDPTDQIAYVVNQGSANISEFTLGSTGTLTPLAGSPVPVGTNPVYMTIVSQ